MMEAPRESSVDGEKEAKKRPLSISSLSSVSSTSLQRLQFKRPNLARDAGEESCSSDQTSQTSSDSNLAWAMADQVSLTSTDSGAALQGRCIADAREGDRRGSASSSVDGHGAKNVNANVSSELSKLHVDVKCEGEAGSGKRSPGYGSRTSSSTSLTNSLGVSQTAATPSSPVSSSGTGTSDSSFSPGTLPVTIKPLQTTIRPVVISLPDIIRRHSRSSASGSVGNVGDMDSCGSSVDGSVSGIGEGGSSVDGDSTVGDDGSSSTDTSAAVTPQRSPLLRNCSQNSRVEPFFNLTVRGTTGTSPTTSTPCPNSVSSPALMSLASSKTSSVPPLSLTRGSAPQHPSPLQNVVQQHSSSPLSPTAIARRRFLASHFDIPDVPPLDPPPCVNGHHDPELEQSRARLPSTGDGVPSSPGSKVPVVSSPDAAVPLSPARVSPLADRSPVSPGGIAAPAWPVINGSLAPPPQNCASSSASDVSTPSPSPTKNEGGFNISPSKDTDSAKQIASAGEPPSGSSPGGIAQPRPPSDYDNQRQAAGASAVDTHTSPAGHTSGGGGGGSATTSPTTRSRSHKRQDGGGVGGGRGGSTKGGPHSYVSYVQRVVTEILDTERMYIDSLEDIIKGYLQPLERLLDTKVGRDDLACLFCNIRDIYTFGKIFLWDLEQCGLDPVKVAECFVRHNTGFVIYTEYCTNYPRAVEVLTRFMQDAELSEVCKSCQQSLGHGLPLGAYLLRPVQRILKYHLLLQNILKNFDKSKPGYIILEKALGHMTAMAHHINEMKRRHEHAVRIQEVQSQLEEYEGEDLTRLGELVLEGSFRVYGAKASRQVFLFEKGILITKKKEGGMLTCKAFIPCSNLMLVEVIPDEPLSFHTIPFDNPRAQHTLQARSMEQKRHWCQEIKRLILESYKGRIPDNVKSLVMELGRNHDNDYVGKDAFDSPWKHQHTAPEYLEKRRGRKKSGGKIPEFGPFLKVQKSGGKRDQGSASKKSPKPWRKSDSKLPGSNRDRSESLPAMLANASSASLPGISAPTSLSSDSVTEQKAASPALQASPSDSNNNNTSSSSSFSTTPMDSSTTANSTKSAANSLSKAEAGQRRASSFKKAVRLQPVSSFDRTEEPNMTVGSLDSKMDTSPLALTANGHREDNECGSSLSECEYSSDTDSEEQQPSAKPTNGSKLTMYSSMPALNSLQRKPAQKRKGEGRTKMLRKTDHVSKSSEVLAGDKTGTGGKTQPSGARQYRRRWEGTEDGLRKKVPALHDSYAVRRSRENLLRRKGLQSGDRSKQEGKTAKLTNWGSVDKLTHGSMSDLSHLKEDPWVRNMDSSSPVSSPRSKNPPSVNSHPLNTTTRSLSLSAAQSKDWNPGNWASSTGRPRTSSDAPEPTWASGKENLDWLVYLNRNAADPDIRERANSLSQLTRPSRRSGEIKPSALRDCNSLSRSSSLCKDLLKRYSLESADKQRTSEAVKFSLDDPADSCAQLNSYTSSLAEPGQVQDSSTGLDETSFQSVGDQDVLMSGSSSTSTLGSSPSSKPKMAGFPADATMPQAPSNHPTSQTYITSDSPQHSPIPSTPHRPPSSQNVHQLLSPRPFSSRNSDVSQVMSPTRVRSPSTGDQAATPSHGSRETSPQKSTGSANWDQLSSTKEAERLPASPKSPVTARSPLHATLSIDGDHMLAEMQKYYETHSPHTPPPTSKFPFCEDVIPTSQSPQSPNHPLLSCDELNVNTNRWSGVSSVSSSSNDGGAGGHHHVHHHHPHAHTLRDPNPNRFSGVSSISTSSYDSQNSTSSDSIVGTLKNKISVWTHKLGGRKSRDEESLYSSQTLSASRDGLASPSIGKTNAELQEVLREHAVGSSLIGSRMANTLPVGFEPILSPSNKVGDQHSSSKENTPEPPARFSFPGMALKRQKHVMDSDAFSEPKSVQQSDSGISVHSCESSDSRQQRSKASTLPSNLSSEQYGNHMDGKDRKRRDSGSSVDSADSFYERRLSVAFESSIPHELVGEGEGGPRSPENKESTLQPRKSIREVVQFIEEKFKPHQPSPVEVKRREPSALIRQRLQSLRDNSTYRRRASNRSVSEDRSRGRERTPESPRIPRSEHRSRRGNQFVHRVPPGPVSMEREMEQELEREKEQERELELVKRQATQGRESEERSDAGSSNLSRAGSMGRLEQLSNDVDNLVIMRGWVRNLIHKFQQFK